MVTLYSAAGIYPGILEAILGSLFCAEAYLFIASLLLSSAGQQLTIRDFLAIGPCMGEYGIRRKIVGVEGEQLKVAVRFASQEAHPSAGRGFWWDFNCDASHHGKVGRAKGASLTCLTWPYISLGSAGSSAAKLHV